MRLRKGVAQKSEARDLHGVAEARRLHIADLDFEKIARRRARDIYRTGQRVDPVQVAPAQVSGRLTLGINDNLFGDNSGSYSATITY